MIKHIDSFDKTLSVYFTNSKRKKGIIFSSLRWRDFKVYIQSNNYNTRDLKLLPEFDSSFCSTFSLFLNYSKDPSVKGTINHSLNVNVVE